MFSIGELSARTGVKVPTIRYYETIGLIAADERSQGNQRRYSRAGLDRLAFIGHSRNLGFSLEAIRELLELSQHPESPCRDAHAIAARNLQQVRERMEQLRRLETELERMTGCDADTVSQCRIIEALADHQHCLGEH